MDYKQKTALGWEIANWLYKHEDFELELADNIFFGLKIGQDITEDDLQGMFEQHGLSDLPFTAADLLRYLNRKDRKAKMIEKYAIL